jgi:hypothetical protein
MLRVYSAAHGLTSTQHAVVEVGGSEIVLRVGPKWTRFSEDRMMSSEGVSLPFALEEDGRVRIGDAHQELDMAAEKVAREMLAG